MGNHTNVGHSAARISANVGFWGVKQIVKLIRHVFVRIWWAMFPGKGVNFPGMSPRTKGQKIIKHIAVWGVRRKHAPPPAKWDILAMADHIRMNLLPVLDGRKLPIDKRRMDKDTWDHVKSVLDSHGIPYVII
jgi:hypothetical protein